MAITVWLSYDIRIYLDMIFGWLLRNSQYIIVDCGNPYQYKPYKDLNPIKSLLNHNKIPLNHYKIPLKTCLDQAVSPRNHQPVQPSYPATQLSQASSSRSGHRQRMTWPMWTLEVGSPTSSMMFYAHAYKPIQHTHTHYCRLLYMCI